MTDDWFGDDVKSETKPEQNDFSTKNQSQDNDDDGWGSCANDATSNSKNPYNTYSTSKNVNANQNDNDGDEWGASNDNSNNHQPRQNNYRNRDDNDRPQRPRRNNDFQDNAGDFGGAEEEKENERPANTYVPELAGEDDENLYKFGNAVGVNFAKYEKVQVNVTGKDIPPKIDSFQTSSLNDLLKKNAEHCKYDEPTPCQKYSIPCVLKRRDLMCCAQTGSGKTAAFLMPIIDLMKQDDTPQAEFDKCQKPQTLILCPTRELAIQTFKNTIRLARNSNLRAVMVYGGTTSRFQMGHVEAGANIVIATVGRLDDLVRKHKINLEDTRYVILDEADRMLDMGFSTQVKQLVTRCNHPERQILMFSATFPTEIQKMASEMMKPDYIFVAIGIIGAANPDITQTVIDMGEVSKLTKIEEMLEENRGKKILIFVKTRKNADFLAAKLSSKNFNSTSIHGDRMQDQRELAISEFDSGKRKVLVATSVASRGLDIPAVDVVINYDMPDEIGDYVHRIGRTGRVGNCGVAITFIDRVKDAAILPALLKTLKDSEQKIPAWLSESVSGDAFTNVADDFNATRDIREYSSSAKANVNNMSVVPSNGGGDDAWGDNNQTSQSHATSAPKPVEVNMGGDDMGW